MEPGLEQMIQELLPMDDVTWGLYAFSRDQLKRQITKEDQIQMIHKAMICGKEYAVLVKREMGTSNPHIIAEKLNLEVVQKSEEITEAQILFARFNPPNQILIMNHPIVRAVQLIGKESSKLIELFQQYSIINTILGHEIFHFLEQKYQNQIYTQTEKVVLWKLFGYRYQSTIRALSEIGAMAFTKELNGLNYSPYLLDVFLYYSYSSVNSRKIYHDIIGISSGGCRLTIENNT